jgi:hypothetical protein
VSSAFRETLGAAPRPTDAGRRRGVLGGLGQSGDQKIVRLEDMAVKPKTTRCCGCDWVRCARCGGLGIPRSVGLGPRSGRGFPRRGAAGPRAWGGLSTAGSGVVHGHDTERACGLRRARGAVRPWPCARRLVPRGLTVAATMCCRGMGICHSSCRLFVRFPWHGRWATISWSGRLGGSHEAQCHARLR